MNQNPVVFLWQDRAAPEGFKSAVCLHGHTLHSKECLDFLPTHLNSVPVASAIVRRYQCRGIQFARAYWTPPLTPAAALRLEIRQIQSLGLHPMVSLTDHDTIDAPIALHLTGEPDVPISVEWTVPYRRAVFHLGIHNLPADAARAWMNAMEEYTAAPDETVLPAILQELATNDQILVVLNHPFWLEEGVSERDRAPALDHLLTACAEFLHAFELNGTRTWDENAATIELARAWSRPVISGGDRHAGEPAACLNLTHTTSFGEFVSEIRSGTSTVIFLEHYREPMALRILEAAWDILRPYPDHESRALWTDRVFYRGDDGATRSLSELWRSRVPWFVKPITAILQLCTNPGLRPAVRFLLSNREGMLP
ncbi:MAG: hypothetical protein ABI759_21200 [Candidatus Solibacter sp.]